MSEVKRPFKILIVGGGPAGLSLGVMLEKHGIDYNIFESHPQIDCPDGAGIGIMPNGCYILDQLGAYHDVLREADGAITYSYIRKSDGAPLVRLPHMGYHQERRHGYAMMFLDRLQFLRVLHSKVQHKDNIHLSSRVDKIEELDDGVQVVTRDGRTFKGDVVIGADGIHSTIRKTLRRNALADGNADYFPEGEEDQVPAYYQCSFGIALDVPTWEPSSQCFKTGEGRSFLVVSGPGGRVYWFLFVKLPQTLYGKDIPRYSEEDEAQFAKENHSVPITETLTFGQLYAKRVSSVLTPLHEMVFKKWFYRRTFLAGDSIHKPNPIGGMGGNGAMETCAELVNELVDLRDARKDGLDGLSQEEITALFTRVQNTRYDRAVGTIQGSHDWQAINAYENPLLSTFILRVMTPLAGGSAFINGSADQISNCSRLKHLPPTSRPHLLPYTRDLAARPISGVAAKAPLGLFALAMVVFWYSAKTAMNLPHEQLGRWGTHGLPFSFAEMGDALAPRVHLISFLASLLSPMLIFTVEGYRIGRKGSPLSLPVLFLLAAQFKGMCLVAPIWFLISALGASQNPVDRPVPFEVARSLRPALVLGFIIPSTLMLAASSVTGSSAPATGGLSSLFQASPVIFSLLTAVLSYAVGEYQRIRHPLSAEETERNVQWYEARDIALLRGTYDFVFTMQSAVHIATLAYAYAHPALSIGSVFLNLPDSYQSLSLADKIFAAVKYDFFLAQIAVAAYSLWTVWSLRAQGYVSTGTALKTAGTVLAGQAAVGPAATWVGLWNWREGVISNWGVDAGVYGS